MYPELLKIGDEIRVIAPSRSMKILSKQTIELATKRLEEMGFKVTFGKNVMNEDEALGCASIKDRVEDLENAFSDKNVKGILTVVGGYTVNQLLPHINYDIIKQNPKVLCGLSDITAMQNAIYAKTGLVTFSGVHYSNFGMKYGFEYSEEYFQKLLISKEKIVDIQDSKMYSSEDWFLKQEERSFIENKGMIPVIEGSASGEIVGGNLCTLNLLQGTEFMPDLEEKILFLEDTANLNSNFLLEFDRNLESLLQSKNAKKIKGIVFGRAEDVSDMTIEKWEKMIKNKDQLSKIPVIINANIGHTTPIFTFPIGGKCEINSSNEICNIKLIKEETKTKEIQQER